ncbi:Phage related protein (plasmid) [Deinococcus geothermalis DSM 11300]|uniref:Phage related protein n=1 Tax=Deinococcus geothermalis (strain DSM 11300 / CIP 105573 / AG-3a) TaxID=319795 RepID=A8ZRH1_DEIGD|nr:hypothetical protein [Deinococcus geothermalis]ABW35080.1 Phage related protein [Deinococcus geothermalis DSM 11300]
MLYKHYEDPTVKTRHANTAQVTIDGEVVAEIAGLTVRESGGTDGSYTVGDARPKEHLHNRWTCTGSINRFVWRESALNKWNIGGTSLLNLPTFEITAVDEVDNAVLFTVTGCTLSDRSMNVQANQRIMQDVSFLAMDIVEGEATGLRGMANTLEEILPEGAQDTVA